MKLILAFAIFVAAVTGFAYFQFNKMQDQMEYLTMQNAAIVANNKTLENAVDANNRTIDAMEEDYANIRKEFDTVAGEFNLYRLYGDEVTDRFEGSDINALALARPELIQRIVNNASAESLRCIELLTGAEKNEKEINATNGREFNSECPWLFE